MLEDLHPLFRCRGLQKFANVLPAFQERPGIVADSFHGCLPPNQIGEGLLEVPFFGFEPLKFRLHAGHSSRSERLQDLDQLAGIGMYLGKAATGQVFFLTKADHFASEARKRFLNDAVPRLDQPADVANATDQGSFERFRRNARRMAGELAPLMLLPRADVVVAWAGTTVGRCPDHVRPALAAKKPREEVDTALRLLEVHPPIDRLADLELHAVELLSGDYRLVAVFLYRLAPSNLPEVNRVAEDSGNFLFGEQLAATDLVRAGAKRRVADAQLVTSYSYNDAGWVSVVTDPRALETWTTYDALGRVIQTIENHQDGTPSNQDDKTTNFTYDGSNHVKKYELLLASGHQETQYVYGVSTSTIASNDLLAAVYHPDPSSGNASSSEADTYTYNALGEVLTFEDRNGTTHAYTRDLMGRLTADAVTTLGSGVDGNVMMLTTAYDSQGNPYLFTSWDAVSEGSVVNQVERLFDGRGQLATEYQEHGGTVSTSTTPKVQYTYSEDTGTVSEFARLATIVYPDGTTVDYNYGTSTSDVNYHISRLTSMTQSSTTLEGYSYLGLSTVVARMHPQPGDDMTLIASSGTGDAGDKYVGLDRFGRVVDLRWKTGSTDLDRFQYGYDRDSNRLWRDNAATSGFGELYTYDGLNQLETFARGTLNSGHTAITGTPSKSQSLSFDAAGNFSSVTTNGTSQSRSHDAQNEITSLGSDMPTYDDNGNFTDDGSAQTMTYDAWNRLVDLAISTNLMTYEYDALGRRIHEVESDGVIIGGHHTNGATVGGGDWHLYYNTAWQVIEDRATSTGATYARYVWSPAGVDLMVLRDRDSDANGSLDQRLYVQQDAQGNVTALVDTTGAVVERSIEDPYGARTVLNASFGSRSTSSYAWRYYHQGLRLDVSQTLYDNRMRMYSPTLMRFLQNDPLGFKAGDENTYRYEGNDPTTYLDRIGTEKLPPSVTTEPKSPPSGAPAGTKAGLRIIYTTEGAHDVSFIQFKQISVRMTCRKGNGQIVYDAYQPGQHSHGGQNTTYSSPGNPFWQLDAPVNAEQPTITAVLDDNDVDRSIPGQIRTRTTIVAMWDTPFIQQEVEREFRSRREQMETLLSRRFGVPVTCSVVVEANFKTYIVVDGKTIGAVTWSISTDQPARLRGWEPGAMPKQFKDVLRRDWGDYPC